MLDQIEDDVIIAGLSRIKEGVLTADWSPVIEGYEIITGETLELPAKKESQVDRIRKKLAEKSGDVSTILVERAPKKNPKNPKPKKSAKKQEKYVVQADKESFAVAEYEIENKPKSYSKGKLKVITVAEDPKLMEETQKNYVDVPSRPKPRPPKDNGKGEFSVYDPKDRPRK